MKPAVIKWTNLPSDDTPIKEEPKSRPKPKPAFRGANDHADDPAQWGDHPPPKDPQPTEQTSGLNHSMAQSNSNEPSDGLSEQRGGENTYGRGDKFLWDGNHPAVYGGSLPYPEPPNHGPSGFRTVHAYDTGLPTAIHNTNQYHSGRIMGFNDAGGYPFPYRSVPGPSFPPAPFTNYQGPGPHQRYGNPPPSYPGIYREHGGPHLASHAPIQDGRVFHDGSSQIAGPSHGYQDGARRTSSRSPLPRNTHDKTSESDA
jgi:hypothetical protein